MTSGKEQAEGKTGSPRRGSRRGALFILGAGAAALALPSYLRRRSGTGEAQPIDGLPGFRRIETGQVTGAPTDPFIGLAPEGAGTAPPRLSRAGFCAAIYPDPPPGTVPVAFFTDAQCPLCRRMEPGLLRRAARGEVALTFHDMTGLGPASELAARALAAAALQHGEAALRQRLMRARRLSDAADISGLADAAGLDPRRLLADMDGAQVEARLATSRALAARLGFPATPGAVIGRTALLGYLDPRTLDRLIADADPGRAACD